MTDEECTLAEIRSVISELPRDEQIRVEAIVITLRNVLRAGGVNSALAFALVGAEEAAK